MNSSNSSFEISLDSTLESVDFPGLVVRRKPEEVQNGHPTTEEPNSLIEDIMRLYLKHNSTLECLTDWVKLFNTRLEDCEKLPPGKEQLLNLFRKNRDLVDIFFFVKCDKCRKTTKVQPDQKKGLKCSYCVELLKTNDTNFFVTIPIEKQIVQTIENNWSDIKKFDQSDDKNSEVYEDAHDGAILRSVLNHYKNSDINVLSFCLNVDGANKFKSNSLSVWPIQLSQNYLPPHLRFLPQNIILNGLYYHKSSDNTDLSFHAYMLPLIEELNMLNHKLIRMTIENEDYKFKPIITHCAVDLPAKSKLQETKQFGGYNACTYCEIPGESVLIEKSKTRPNGNLQNKTGRKVTMKINQKRPKKSNVKSKAKPTTNPEVKARNFIRHVECACVYKPRDEFETLEKMLTASEYNGKEPIDGIKDVSCLVGLEHFNIIWSIGVEYMHCCLQGAEKRLMNLFLNSKFSDKDHYIGPSKRKILDKKIMRIKPTSSIVRKPRSLLQRSNFKASEYRSMLLYYLPVCLPGSLNYNYVKHVRLLSAGVYILLKKSILREEVDRAEEMLHLLVAQHQELFGRENMVMGIHLLKHLAESVRQLGPLWCHSAFPFERNNGCLLKLANNTSDVLHQISSKYCLARSMNKRKVGNVVENDAKVLLGREVKIEISAARVFDISSYEIINLKNISLPVHKRIKFNKITYTSMLYTRPKRSIDYFIGLSNGTVGTAKYYFSYKEKVYVMLKVFKVIDTIDHISKVLATNRS